MNIPISQTCIVCDQIECLSRVAAVTGSAVGVREKNVKFMKT